MNKEFTKFLAEMAPQQTSNTMGFPGTPATMSIDDVVMGDIFNLQDEQNIGRLNGYLEMLSNQPVINPYFLLKRIQDKLSVIGLHFVVPKLIGTQGQTKAPLTQFGGTYGYEKMDPFSKEHVPTKDIGLPKIGNTDGLDRLEHGLSLQINWTCVKGIYTLSVQVVNAPSHEEFPIRENEEIDEKHIGFDKLKNKLSHEKGIYNPGGLAAAIGDEKYGKKKMHKAAASGHELHEEPKGLDESSKCPGCGKHNTTDANSHVQGWTCFNCKTHVLGSSQDPKKYPDSLKPLPRQAKLDEVTPPGWSASVKAMKRHRNIKNPFALAWFMKKHGAHAHYDSGSKVNN